MFAIIGWHDSSRRRRDGSGQDSGGRLRATPRRPGVEGMEDRLLLSTISVDTFADVVDAADGRTGLREALTQAAARGGDDTIVLPGGIYKLTQGQLTVDDASGKVTIRSGVGPATIDAQGASRVFWVGEGSEAEFRGLTITGGRAGDFGGGLYNAGTATIADSTVGGNSAVYGGGLYNLNRVTLTNSGLSGNTAGGWGGGLANFGTATIDASALSGNSASGNGGGIVNSTTVTIANSTVSGNTAGGWGGGLHNESGTVSITASTFGGNSADRGGGLANFGTTTIDASTLSRNSARLDGGLYNYHRGTVNALSTIIAGNAGQDIGGPLASTSTYNLIGTGGGLTDGVNGNRVGIADPLLGPLQDNGGLTWTMAPRPGSPALDAGDPGVAGSTDQRGVSRPKGPGADIGAVELRYAIAAVGGDNQATTVGQAFADPLRVRVLDEFGNPVPDLIVTFAAPTDGAGGSFGDLQGTAAVTTDADGIAVSPTLVANTVAGSYAVTASLGNLVPASFSLTNAPGAPAILTAVAGSGQSATVATEFGTPMVAQVVDRFGNPVPGVIVTFAAPSGGAGGWFQDSGEVVTDADGIAVSPTLVANTVAGSYAVTASAGGLDPAASFSLTNRPAAASQLLIGGPTALAIGQAGTYTVTAVDRYGNLVDDFHGVIALACSDTSAQLPASLTLSGGIGSFTTTFRKAGSPTLYATGPDGLAGSLLVTVTAGSKIGGRPR